MALIEVARITPEEEEAHDRAYDAWQKRAYDEWERSEEGPAYKPGAATNGGSQKPAKPAQRPRV